MSIRHKVNLPPQLTDFDSYLTKSSDKPTCQPSTPNFLSTPQKFDDLHLLRKAKDNFSSNMVESKSQNIKSIDEKINSIMKKHENKEDFSEVRSPLKTKNVFEEEW